MKSHFLPYATTPGRLLVQLSSDVAIAVWTFLWVSVGLAVHGAISIIGSVGGQVESGAQGVAGNLESAGESAGHIPLVGDTLSKPLIGASSAALDIAGAGHTLNTTASWLALLLAMAVAAPPVAVVGMPWLVLRLRFLRRKRAVLTLAGTAAGQQLLALRALCNRPLRKLTAVTLDPVGAWRRNDSAVIHRLVAVELRSAGLARHHEPAPMPS
ncbi:MAG TPA: hypothetical protein VFQ37_07300 [Mycobacterium sp.]|nr:hypothetical protein [Mycobacterium sp.]